ncbi:hypothetical protein B0F90DRAFT_1378437 [Multifurca ochricompacta]|uniref:BTB domain-containing protein n=1 Tax=Multifurca ochricompacta TaxID=376703 RepID=A0AAD4M6M4_9AGAM|nr:hypothetical protein B0F90DRAFT_1378437 [Multifurca ochricompacta]
MTTLINHLYHTGFQSGNYADTLLHVHQNTYHLHAIILSRSPYLVQLMSTSPQVSGQRVIYIPLGKDSEATLDGFAIALGYLYSPASLALIKPENARGVLAAGCLLGGVDDLCNYAYEACREAINLSTIASWLAFVDATPHSDDTASPGPSPIPTSAFGSYTLRLRESVLHFLMIILPAELDLCRDSLASSRSNSASPSPASSGRDTLLQIFSQVPFDAFKAIVESPAFQIGSEQARFQFAKDAIQLRKHGVARSTGAEEAVVLAFGGGNTGGSVVHVTRKISAVSCRPL